MWRWCYPFPSDAVRVGCPQAARTISGLIPALITPEAIAAQMPDGHSGCAATMSWRVRAGWLLLRQSGVAHPTSRRSSRPAYTPALIRAGTTPPALPADREAQATQDGNRPLAPWSSTRSISHYVSPL